MLNRGYISFSNTPDGGFKIGDQVVAAHVVRLFCENEKVDEWILSLNPQNPLNFVFRKAIEEFHIRVVTDAWQSGDLKHLNRVMEERRNTRLVHEYAFTLYKEIYRRVDGGPKQMALCGVERGLGRRNIFEYYYFGQESKPETCIGGDRFGSYSLGFERKTTTPFRSVFIAPHAHSQENKVFTMDFWRDVIQRLTNVAVDVTVCTPNEGYFGSHPNLHYFFQKDENMPALFETIGSQQLVLCGNTGIGWIAGAYGVPVIVGQPKFYFFKDYAYDSCGMESLVSVFGQQSGADRDGSNFVPADPQEPVDMVLRYWEEHA